MNRTCKTLIQALLAGTAITQPGLVGAGELPTGATTVYGGVGISTPSANQMTIQQTTPTAIVNWQGFSVGAGNRVDINQPSASSAILNRVTGSATSTIAGQINANGQVYLVNPNGIAITSSGTVRAGAFVASTLDISDQDFASGKRTFRGNGQSAAVSNQGTIEIQRGGYAALLGGKVDNSGVISVPMGRVGLGAGEQATLDFSGDGFLQVAIPSKDDGSDKALIQHSGRISAPGGQVVMQVATARAAARNAINLSGLVEAHSVGGRNGAIVLGGGEGGTVTVSGRLDASARGAVPRHAGRSATRMAARGGDITVTGDAIRLQGAALLADGQAGGGTIRVGGGFQGQGTLQRASTTSVDAATTISANAGRTGNGGDVVVWSDHRTDFAGLISATGGAQGGNGGQAEVSSKGVLAYDGTTILTAAKGSFGTLLLDPYNVTISSGTDANQSGFAATGNDSVINATTLQNALRTANVTVTTGGSGSAGTQAGDITVAAPLTWGTGTGGSATVLTLSAYRSIMIGATVTVSGSGGLVLNTNQGGTGGTLTFGPNASATFTGSTTAGQSLTINAKNYVLINSATNFGQVFANPGNLGGSFALAGDINATGFPLVPIGTPNAPFTGSLEGLGHTVSGVRINSAAQYVGLFGNTNGATIENLNLNSIAITSTYAETSGSYVGGLVALANNTTLHGVTVSGTVTGTSATTPASSIVGGLAGALSGSVQGSSSTATVTGGNGGFAIVGGLVGQNNGTITQSYATGTVSAGVTSNAFNDSGGLIGQNNGTVSQSYASGTVNGGSSGATGSAGDTGAGTFTGGLIGFDGGSTLSQVYATGAVNGGSAPNGNSYTGGLTGYSTIQTSQAYAVGRVTAGSGANVFTGGLVGYVTGSATASFWDTSATGQAAAAGNVASLAGATGLTTAQFQDTTGFTTLAGNQGWNFQTTWAPPSAGFYPELYSVSRVISVTADPQSRTYGAANPTLTGTVSGGPGVNGFDPSAAGSPGASTLLTTSATAGSDVGSYTISPIGTRYVSIGGVSYRVTGIGNALSVTPAPLTVTANDQTKVAGTTFAFAGTEFTSSGLVNGDRITSAALSSDGAPSSALAGTYPITIGSAVFSGADSQPRSAGNYRITYVPGTFTVSAAPATTDPATQASNLNDARVTPNVTTILPNFNVAALSLADSLELNSGGGPTLGVGQASTTGDGSSTRAGAQTALNSIQRASNLLDERLAACDSKSGAASRGVANCYSDALGGFADQLDIQLQQLPPAFRSLPAVIRQAAQRVRAARTVAEARAAVNVAVVAVRKAISLLRADEPAVARIQVRQGNAIASALRTVDNRLSRAVGL